MTLHPLAARGAEDRSERDVIVIGAGHNGLVAACYLARAGVKVEVIEAGDTVGGCTRTEPVIEAAPHHQINLGAVDFLWIHASSVIADLELRRFGYAEVDLDPAFAYLHRDGSSVAVWRDPARTADEIRRYSARDATAYLEFARAQDALFDVLMPFLTSSPTRPPLHGLLAGVRALSTQPRRLAPFTKLLRASAVEIIDDRFRHPMTRDLLAGMAAIAAPITDKGSGVALLFGGLVHRLGMTRPIGGSQALPDALHRCLLAHGGRVRTSAPVQEIITTAGTARGVRLTSGEEITARAVLASCDPTTTLTRLLPPGALSPRQDTRAQRIPTTNGGAAHVKIDLALSGRIHPTRHAAARSDGLDLRAPSVFTGSMDELVGALHQARAGTIPDPLPLWIIIPTAADPSQAPQGQDTLYLWAGWMPQSPQGGWERSAAAGADALVADAARYFDGITDLELGRHIKTPIELARDMRLSDGQPWHVDFTRTTLGPLRPAPGFGGYRTPINGLFLTGAGTHPSPGVAALPGQLAATEVERALRHSHREVDR